MLAPKKVKHQKMHLRHLKGNATTNTKLTFGVAGLQAKECGIITARQLVATKRTLTKYIKKYGKVWLKLFPDCSVTARSKESRMGSGKGSVSHWVCLVRPKTIIFEVSEVPMPILTRALSVAASKLPLKTLAIYNSVKQSS
jgi:large subunit ribosomal protein L16